MSKTVKTILIVVLCLVLIGGIAGVVAWTQSDKFDQKDLSYVGKYEVGGLDSNGSYMSTNASIYTKKPIECQGLNCNLVFDSTISYQLYFYDQNNEFVHTTGKLTGTFVEDGVPFFAKYVRIVVTPNDDEKVTSLEVGKYAKQLNVSVNREQGFKNYTENLWVTDKVGAYINQSTGVVTENDTTHPDNILSKKINIASYKEGLMFRSIAPLNLVSSTSTYWCAFYDVENNYVGAKLYSDLEVFVSSEGIYYYNLPLKDLQLSNGKVVSDGYVVFISVKDKPLEIYFR